MRRSRSLLHVGPTPIIHFSFFRACVPCFLCNPKCCSGVPRQRSRGRRGEGQKMDTRSRWFGEWGGAGTNKGHSRWFYCWLAWRKPDRSKVCAMMNAWFQTLFWMTFTQHSTNRNKPFLLLQTRGRWTHVSTVFGGVFLSVYAECRWSSIFPCVGYCRVFFLYFFGVSIIYRVCFMNHCCSRVLSPFARAARPSVAAN